MAETHHFDAARLFDVRGFVALVTGGGTGIGLMAAQALAANGARVYITGRRMEALENAARAHSPRSPSSSASGSGEILPIGPCDVTSKADLQRVCEELRDGRGERRLHLLVCAAGIAGPKADPSEADDDADDLKARLWDNESVEAWQDTFRVDVTAVYFTTVAFLPLLQAAMEERGRRAPPAEGEEPPSEPRARGGGGDAAELPAMEAFGPSVITISSMSGIMRHAQGHFSYNTAKGATVHLSKLMSAEFQRARVRVNSIAPGYFPSEMTAKEASDARQKSHVPPEKIQEKGHVPLMRPGRDQEIGMSVLYLAKNQYVNGEIIAVDGGVLNVLAGR